MMGLGWFVFTFQYQHESVPGGRGVFQIVSNNTDHLFPETVLP